MSDSGAVCVAGARMWVNESCVDELSLFHGSSTCKNGIGFGKIITSQALIRDSTTCVCALWNFSSLFSVSPPPGFVI